ncbi:MAG: DDE-type integrase/transposase/recombinase [Hyphomonadaceae bacterium]|nr:DDE-type integrase/transposase/recombinase [Hyphomonadaceae bacterium]
MVWTIGRERVWIWLAVDDEGEVMDMIVQKRRDTGAALRLLRRLLRNQHVEPEHRYRRTQILRFCSARSRARSPPSTRPSAREQPR